jgi:hypothetical protein
MVGSITGAVIDDDGRRVKGIFGGGKGVGRIGVGPVVAGGGEGAWRALMHPCNIGQVNSLILRKSAPIGGN